MVISLLFITVFFLAYANGANDNFKGVATLFGSGAASYRSALGWASISTLAGSMSAFFLAQTLMVKFSGKGLAPETLIHSSTFMISVAAGAGLTIILATRFGFPVSTTHALLGAMVGSTLLANQGVLSMAPLVKNFLLPLLLSPLAAISLAAMLYQLTRLWMRNFPPIPPAACVCLEEASALSLANATKGSMQRLSDNSGFMVSVDRPEICAERDALVVLGVNTQKLLDALHFCSAGAVCFARGLNDTPKIAALLLLVPGFSVQANMLVIASAMLFGGIFNARRVAETMSHKITTFNHQQGLTANLTTAFLVIIASKWGLPVSTTHVSVGSLFGISTLTGKRNNGMIASIALSWLLTLPCAAGCAAMVYGLTTTLNLN